MTRGFDPRVAQAMLPYLNGVFGNPSSLHQAGREAHDALETARAELPDLILLDVVMPGMDGCEVAARIHTDQELKDTPIVFLTALATNKNTGGHATVAGSTVYLA